MKVFLTGSTGFIGSHIAEHLNKIGYQVSCLIRQSKNFPNMNNITLINADLRAVCDRKTAYDLVKGHDYVIHCAAIRGEKNLPWSEYYKINVEATQALLEASLQAGVKKFIYLSSVGVLGTMPSQLPATEDTPYEPDGYYHKSKMIAEQQVIEFSRRGLHAVAIRPSITYGSHDNGFFLRIARIASKGIFPLVRGGRNLIHLTYINGLVDAIVRTLSTSVAPGGIYIIVDNAPITFKELMDLIAITTNRKIKYVNIPSSSLVIYGAKLYDTMITPITKGASLTASTKILALPWYYDCSKAASELGYKPFDTKEQVPKTIEWLNLNGMINI